MLDKPTEKEKLEAEVEKAEVHGTAGWAVVKIVQLVFEFLAFVIIVGLIAHSCDFINLQPLVDGFGK